MNNKWFVIVAMVLIAVMLSGCKVDYKSTPTKDPATVVTTCKCSSSPVPSITTLPTSVPEPNVTLDEAKRTDLYVFVMKGVYLKSKMGKEFIAIKLNTLDGLKPVAKSNVMAALKDLQAQGNILSYEVNKDNPTLFDEKGQPINGTVLSIKLIEYTETTAKIEATSFFGVVGADYVTYDAVYQGGVWMLKEIGWGVS